MTYETAKKLKDAGFVHRHLKDIRECPDGHDHTDDGYNCAPPPTLSELIEACPKTVKDCKGFTLLHTGSESQMWCAGYSWHELWDGLQVDGSTPEEAVANLWLALNTK